MTAAASVDGSLTVDEFTNEGVPSAVTVSGGAAVSADLSGSIAGISDVTIRLNLDDALSFSIPQGDPSAEEVNVMVWQRTDLGYKVIVENQFSGMLFHNEVFQPLEAGMHLSAFVKQVRPDGKIDLELQKAGARKVDDFSEVLLQYIKDNDSFTPLNDKTDAEVIYQTFGVSKKTFKKAVGDLYKKRLVVLEEGGIRLV